MAMTRTVLSMDRPGSSASVSARSNGAGRINLTSTNMTFSSSYGGTSGDYSNDESVLSPLSKKKSSQSPSKISMHTFDNNRRAALTQSHCAFCLVAEFDIDKGSTLSHQFPSTIDYDDHLLAELMLPDGVHARSEDWTVFFLPAQAVPERKTMSGQFHSHQRSSNSSKGKERSRDDLYYVLNLVRTKHDESVRRGALVKAIAVGSKHPFIQIFKPILLLALDEYFNSPSADVLARLYDSLNALDLTAMPQLNRNEKLILRAAERRDLFEERFKAITPTRIPSNLRHLTNLNDEDDQESMSGRPRSESASTIQSSIAEEAVNAASSSVVGSAAGRSTPHLLHRPSLASLKPGSNAASIMKRRPSAATQLQLQQGDNDLDGSRISLPSLSCYRAANGSMMSPVTSMQDGKVRDTHYWETSVTYGKIQDLPIRIPTDTFPEEIGEYSLVELMTTFASSTPVGPLHAHLHSNGQLTPAVILLFNAIITSKRIIFLGHNQPASRVALHVLSACALGSGCGVTWRGIAKRCFPYANLGIIDELEKVPGFIAGVTNPRFEDLPVWDLLFNVENGRVIISKDIEIPSPFSPGHVRPSMAQSQSSGSMGSSFGHGLDGETKLSRAPTEINNISNGAPNLGMSAGGTIRGRDRAGTVLEAKVDSPDTLFMEELSSAIIARYGERYIRTRWTDWACNFLRQVARHEEHFYGEIQSQLFLNGQLGSGLITSNRELEMKEIQSCALRIEAFRASDAYRLCRQDELDRDSSKSITGFDLTHQLARLRRARNMSLREGELIFATIARAVQTSDQIIELLAHLPLHQGGLVSISSGLFHPSSAARIAIQDLLIRLTLHPVGKKFIQSLNLYHRLAFARLLHETNEATQGLLVNNDSTSNSAQRPFISMASSTATQSKHSFADSPKDGLPLGSNGFGSYLASQCSREGMPLNDAISSSLSNYSRSASPAYF